MTEETTEKTGGMPKSLIIKLVAVKLVVIAVVVGAVWYLI